MGCGGSTPAEGEGADNGGIKTEQIDMSMAPGGKQKRMSMTKRRVAVR